MRAPMAERGEDQFKVVRAAASGQLVIVRPDGQWLLLPALRKDAVSPRRVAAVERMMPSQTKRNVAVIGEVIWAAGDIPTLQAANHAIPIFGPLMGLASYRPCSLDIQRRGRCARSGLS